MRRQLRHFILTLMVMGCVFGAVSMAAASSIDINSVSGSWINAVPASAVTINNTNSLSTARWGYSTGYGQSGYNFLAATTPFSAIADGTPFALGTFTHLNFPITGTFMTSIDLLIALGIQDFGSLSATFDYAHNETPNNYFPDSNPLNDDIVTLTNPILNRHFISGGFDYYFNLIGFSQNGGTTISTVFKTVEGQANNATLYAEITTTPVPGVPEPATMLLLGLGLMGLAGVRRKIKN